MRVLETASSLFKRGFHEEALEVIDEQLGHSPDEGRLWELRGLILRAMGKLALACDSLEHASLLIPLSASGQLTLADCCSRLDQRDLALLVGQHLLARGQLDPSLLLHLAHIFDRCGQPSVSVEICRLACRRDPGFHQAAFDTGYFLGRNGQPAEEIEAAAREAIRIAPHHVNYRVALAVFLWQHERGDEALAEVEFLTLEQLGKLSCACCLGKLVSIYEHGAAEEQCRACAERIGLLEAAANADFEGE